MTMDCAGVDDETDALAKAPVQRLGLGGLNQRRWAASATGLPA